MATIEEDALEVLRLERVWVDNEDDDVDEGLRYDFIEAASDLAQRVAGVRYEYNRDTETVTLVPVKEA